MHEFSHQNLTHTLHQALHWVQSSPPLFGSEAHSLCLDQPLPGTTKPITLNEQQLASLVANLHQKNNSLLGIFYEQVWQFLLNEIPNTRLLAHNLPVRQSINQQLQTLGEYDLIYQHGDRVTHRELAVKFYLGVPCAEPAEGGTRWQQWVGPGLKDRLDRKMQHLFQHQIALSNSPAGQAALEPLGVGDNIQREILIQGRLFYPATSKAVVESGATFEQNLAPKHCHPQHLQGLWITVEQLQQWSSVFARCEFQIPNKRQWLNELPQAPVHFFEQIITHCHSRQMPEYLLVYSQQHHPHPHPHPLHLFVVPNDWLNKAQLYSQATF